MRPDDIVADGRSLRRDREGAPAAVRFAAALLSVVFLVLVPSAAGAGVSVTDLTGKAGPAAPSAAPGPGLPPTAESAPPPIPVADLGGEADRTLAHLRSILSQLRREVSLAHLDREMPPILESISELKEAEAVTRASQPTVRAIVNLQQEWLLDDARLAALEADLGSRVQGLLQLRDELRRTKDLWKRTREAAKEASAPAALLERADLVLAAVSETERALEARLAPALVLQGRIVEARLAVSDGLDWIETVTEELKRDLFRLDSPPLWEAFHARPTPAAPARLAGAERIDGKILANFLRTYPVTVGFHFLAAVGLLILLLRLRHKARGSPSTPLAGAAEGMVLARPLATMLLVAVMGCFFLYPRAPVALLELAGMTSVLPILILLPHLTQPQARPAAYSIVAIFLLQRGSLLFEGGALPSRISLLTLTLAVVLVFSWWLRKGSSLRTLPPSSWRSAAWALARVALAMLLLSLGLNVAGNVTLAQLLTNATVISSYLAVVCYLTALVLQALIAVTAAFSPARSLNIIRMHGDRIRQHLARWTAFGFLVLWMYFSAKVFGIADPALAELSAWLARTWTLGTVTISPGSILAFAVTLWLSVLLSRLLRFVLEGDVFPRLGLQRGVAETISMIFRYGLIALGFLLALAAAGVQLSQFTILAGTLGVGIGFGLQSVVNNFVSGLILMFERPIQVGDTIQVKDVLGRVRNIGVRTSTVRTYDGADVVVPNANLTSGEVVNWTLSDRLRRVEIAVGVAYGSQPAAVLALLEGAARAHPEVLTSPAPQALFLRFGESSLDFALRFWTANFDDWVKVQSDVAVRVHDALHAAGIDIPFPQRVVRLTGGDRDSKPAST